jgi:hypothetical protein
MSLDGNYILGKVLILLTLTADIRPVRETRAIGAKSTDDISIGDKTEYINVQPVFESNLFYSRPLRQPNFGDRKLSPVLQCNVSKYTVNSLE